MKKHLFSIAVIAAVFLNSPVFAMFRRPDFIPVERMLSSAEKYLKAHPASSEAHYILARIHYLAFINSSSRVLGFSGEPPDESDEPGNFFYPADRYAASGLYYSRWERARELARAELARGNARVVNENTVVFWPTVESYMAELERKNWRPPSLTQSGMKTHAAEALAHFKESIRLDLKNGLYALGLASLMEQIVDWKENEKPVGLTTELAALDYAQAREAYLVAYRAAFAADSARSDQPLGGLGDLVSYEAGNAFVRLTEKETKPTNEQSRVVDEVKAGLKKLDSLPEGAITPIVFALRSVTSVDELLAPEVTVGFDLRGYGPEKRWPWVRHETALLVWDPARRGEITSGQQLFGGYTFQVFRANGYDALAALDANGDGVLNGDELVGIRAWFDENSDGVCSPGEVRDLAELGIVGIAVRATRQEGQHLKNEAGLMFSNGHTLPTWDWMAEPVKR
jgi:hypothetical protein